MGEDTIISSLVESMDTNRLEETKNDVYNIGTYYTTAMV